MIGKTDEKKDTNNYSKGLLALVEALTPLAQIVVVAPTTEKSACGHSLTHTTSKLYRGIQGFLQAR